MYPFENLRIVVIEQNLVGEFPEWLLADVLDIADNPEKYGDNIPLIEKLIAQINEYDPFAGAGCFDSSVGIEAIQATIGKIKIQRDAGMPCEILECCQFLNTQTKGMPKTVEYIRNNVCFGKFESCVRFQNYKKSAGEHIPLELYPHDTEEVKKIVRCLRNKKETHG